MSIVNPNGTERKPAKPIVGRIFAPGLASVQHGTPTFVGRTYNSPFTVSSRGLFGPANNVSTQAQIPATKVESPGVVVLLNYFVKVHPNEKGSTFSTNVKPQPVVKRTGGPSKHADVPTNPNKKIVRPRPYRSPSVSMERHPSNPSFFHSNATLGTHANQDKSTPRWAHTVRTAVSNV